MAVALYNKSSMPGKSRESSQLSSSSTPHAPRRKPYSSDFLAQPSMRTVVKKHSYLDQAQMRLTTNNKVYASTKPVEKVQAWVEKQVTTPPSTSSGVMPVCTAITQCTLSAFYTHVPYPLHTNRRQ